MKRIFEFALVLGLLVVMISSVAVVGASDSQAVSGTWQFTSVTPLSAQPAGENCIVVLAYTQAYQGDIVGTVTAQVRIVRRGACDQTGAVEIFHTEGAFEGTVAGASGTFEFQGEGQADTQSNLQGQFVILTGTDELANLHGQLDVTGNLVTSTGTYSGDIHFD